MSWHELNQRHLVRAIHAVRDRLSRHGNDHTSDRNDLDTAASSREAPLDPPAALDQLCAAFGLSSFERDVLLLCAGVELDSGLAAFVASAQTPPRAAVTFGFALATLAAPHWSALTPAGPLRRWRLLDVGAGETLTGSPLRVDERVLHYLSGISYLDERLSRTMERVQSTDELPEGQRLQSERIARACMECRASVSPVVHLYGVESESRRAVAAAICARLGLGLHAMAAADVPTHSVELDSFIHLWQRDSVLCGSALLIECEDGGSGETASRAALDSLLQRIHGLVITSSSAPRRAPRRSTLTFEVCKPTRSEQQVIWRRSLGPAAARLNGKLDALGAQFDLDAAGIRLVCEQALQEEDSAPQLEATLWESCRAQTRPKLDELAQRILTCATWDDLVLPEPQLRALHEIASHVRHRARVLGEWGFGEKSARGLGVSALFAGPSGTGKTMAAEVLAQELRLDLHRIDLSQVISKYIGETEKNLRQVFDSAERGCSILLFDEADALFGKRSEVKDSHDRYANVEVSYLLQRMEAYSGLAILTTNMQSALDPAFLRRLRFVVSFPFPGAAERAEIWRKAFPRKTPTEALDFAQLARLQVAGGNIHNIAMHAAFLASDAEDRVRMAHLLEAARSEYRKLDRALTDAETGAWR